MSPETILRFKHLCTMLRLSRATIYRMIQRGDFPKPFPLSSPHAVGFIKADVDAWLEQRRQAPGAKGAA